MRMRQLCCHPYLSVASLAQKSLDNHILREFLNSDSEGTPWSHIHLVLTCTSEFSSFLKPVKEHIEKSKTYKCIKCNNEVLQAIQLNTCKHIFCRGCHGSAMEAQYEGMPDSHLSIQDQLVKLETMMDEPEEVVEEEEEAPLLPFLLDAPHRKPPRKGRKKTPKKTAAQKRREMEEANAIVFTCTECKKEFTRRDETPLEPKVSHFEIFNSFMYEWGPCCAVVLWYLLHLCLGLHVWCDSQL